MNFFKSSILGFIALIIFIAMPLSVSAQSDETVSADITIDETITAADLGVSEPTILPDSPWYIFKDLWRGLSVAMTFNQTAKAEKQLQYANERVIEAQELFTQNQDDKTAEALKQTMERYQKNMEKMQQAVEKIGETTENNQRLEQLVQKIGEFEIKRRIILAKISDSSSEDVAEKIMNAQQTSGETFGKILESTVDTEKIAEKINEILEKQGGSNFKDLKQLEIIKALSQDVPENVKEKLQQVEDKLVERFEEKTASLDNDQRERLQTYVEDLSGNESFRLEALQQIMENAQVSGAVKNIISGLETTVRAMFEERLSDMENSQLRENILSNISEEFKEKNKIWIERMQQLNQERKEEIKKLNDEQKEQRQEQAQELRANVSEIKNIEDPQQKAEALKQQNEARMAEQEKMLEERKERRMDILEQTKEDVAEVKQEYQDIVNQATTTDELKVDTEKNDTEDDE